MKIGVGLLKATGSTGLNTQKVFDLKQALFWFYVFKNAIASKQLYFIKQVGKRFKNAVYSVHKKPA
ncbi:hypothetical protein GCM10027043_02210 [Ferruginibacter profundus]